eukprot:Rhum_TRINITY_DN7885_c0_g2::Rhum_TRINITY_DN7885_c0_g2_i1::g.24995::m.24995
MKCPVCGGQSGPSHACPLSTRPPDRALEAAASRGDMVDWPAKTEVVLVREGAGRLEWYMYGTWKGAITKLELLESGGSRAYVASLDTQRWIRGIFPKLEEEQYTPPVELSLPNMAGRRGPPGAVLDASANITELLSSGKSSAGGTRSVPSNSARTSGLDQNIDLDFPSLNSPDGDGDGPEEWQTSQTSHIGSSDMRAEAPAETQTEPPPATRSLSSTSSESSKDESVRTATNALDMQAIRLLAARAGIHLTEVGVPSASPSISPHPVLPPAVSLDDMRSTSSPAASATPPPVLSPPVTPSKKRKGLSGLFSKISESIGGTPRSAGAPSPPRSSAPSPRAGWSRGERLGEGDGEADLARFEAPLLPDVVAARGRSDAVEYTTTVDIRLCRQGRLERMLNGEWFGPVTSIDLGHTRQLVWKIPSEAREPGERKIVDQMPMGREVCMTLLDKLIKLTEKAVFNTSLRELVYPIPGTEPEAPSVDVQHIRTPVLEDLLDDAIPAGRTTLWPLPPDPPAGGKKKKSRKKNKSSDDIVEEPVEDDAPFQDVPNPCCICLEAERNTVFFPCRHLCACKGCSMGCKTCPLCRIVVAHRVEIWQ